jgi:prepilin-type N-terminal cleavage/methylation domain-containing protein
MAIHMRQQEGFSLIEVTVSITVMLIILSAVFVLVGQAQKVAKTQQPLAFVQNDLRNALTIMSRDVQMAGFFDTINTTRVKPSVDFDGIPAATATENSFQLVMQRWNGTMDLAETITYVYDAASKQLRRNNTTLLLNVSQIDSSTPIFSYIDDPNDATAKIGVIVRLQASTGQLDPYTNQPIKRQISTTLLSRNSKYASDRLNIKSTSSSGSGGNFNNVPIAAN